MPRTPAGRSKVVGRMLVGAVFQRFCPGSGAKQPVYPVDTGGSVSSGKAAGERNSPFIYT